MKVLMINVVCGIRSTGRICTDLAVELEKQGHEVKIAYGRENVPKQFQKYAVRIGTDLDVKLHGIKARLLDGAGFGSKNATVKFIRWIKEYDPDVIHLNNIHGYYINIEVLFKYLRICGKKIIWTLHDCWSFTGHSAYCDAVQCERWVQGCYKCPQRKEYPKSIIDASRGNWIKKKKIFSDIPNMTIITPSNWLAELVKKSFLGKYPVEVIHNGIDTNQFKPLKNDFREVYHLEDKFIVLGIATVWNDMKGYSDFIKLASMLDDFYKIVMVGLTEEQIEKLPVNILGIKRTASVKELTYIYSAADIFLNLSYCENYPTVNLEAKACGLQVITYDAGGSCESAGENCIIVEKGNVSEIAEKIQHISKIGVNKSKDSVMDKGITVKSYLTQYQIGGGYWKVKYTYGAIGKRVVLCVAAVWDERKGLKDVFELSEKLSDEYLIIVVGVNRLQMKKIPKKVVGITRTDSISCLAELYSIADVFFNPTYEDNYPTTNLEAISCGTAVITYNTGGSAESAMLYGKVFAQGNIKAIAEQIRSNENIKKESMNIDKNTMLAKYLEIFRV